MWQVFFVIDLCCQSLTTSWWCPLLHCFWSACHQNIPSLLGKSVNTWSKSGYMLDDGVSTCASAMHDLYSLDDIKIMIYLVSLKLHIKLKNVNPFEPQLNAQMWCAGYLIWMMKTVKWLPSQPCIWFSGHHSTWCVYQMLYARGLIGSLPILLDPFVWKLIIIIILHDKLTAQVTDVCISTSFLCSVGSVLYVQTVLHNLFGHFGTGWGITAAWNWTTVF
jgi:hypothetical protein